MSLIQRTGQFGVYYGNTYDSSKVLNKEQMEVNATYIFSYLKNKGWSDNSISALLGNMQAESSINPGRWQSDRVGGDPEGHGYSLVQWTPYTKYINWCSEQGFEDPSEMDTALTRIMYEVENGIQWIPVGRFSDMSFKDFTTSLESVSELAAAFLLCYERPADQSAEKQAYRGELASSWYEYLLGVTPNDPDNPSGKKKKSKFKFILFKNQNRRSMYG